MNLEIIIPSDEPVRLLSAVTEELNYTEWTATDSRLGKIEYSPRLLFKMETINGWLKRLKRYNLDIHICGDRNSYSKTDPDATFMHRKEDHMKNGQLKPGYNVNVATASEYIIGNYISADRTDTKVFIPFLKKLCQGHPVKRNVTVEWYLVSIAYNILKLHHKIQTGQWGNHLFVSGVA